MGGGNSPDIEQSHVGGNRKSEAFQLRAPKTSSCCGQQQVAITENRNGNRPVRKTAPFNECGRCRRLRKRKMSKHNRGERKELAEGRGISRYGSSSSSSSSNGINGMPNELKVTGVCGCDANLQDIFVCCCHCCSSSASESSQVSIGSHKPKRIDVRPTQKDPRGSVRQQQKQRTSASSSRLLPKTKSGELQVCLCVHPLEDACVCCCSSSSESGSNRDTTKAQQGPQSSTATAFDFCGCEDPLVDTFVCSCCGSFSSTSGSCQEPTKPSKAQQVGVKNEQNGVQQKEPRSPVTEETVEKKKKPIFIHCGVVSGYAGHIPEDFTILGQNRTIACRKNYLEHWKRLDVL